MTTKINDTHELILDFIASLHGCPSYYWMARILETRFTDEDARIVYNPRLDMFACLINDRIYGISGEIVDTDEWIFWTVYQSTHPERAIELYRDCVLRLSPEAHACVRCAKSFLDDWGNLICAVDSQPYTGNTICNKEEHYESKW